jgi:PAS domain S-box-containing protein
MKILAIDDNADNLISLAAMLRAFLPGCATATAISGTTGIEQARAFQPDTILLDIQMPGVDGYQTCEALKRDPATRHIPIIFLTARKTDSASRIQGLELGGDAFLTKPVEPGELLAQVRAMVRIKRAEDALRQERDSLEATVAQRTAALRTETANLDAIFNCSPIAMLVLDEHLNVVRMNTAAATLAGGTAADFECVAPGNALRCKHSFEDPRGCGHAAHCSFCPLRKGLESVLTTAVPLRGVEVSLELLREGAPQTIWLRVGAEPLRSDGHRHLIIALDDITASKQAEEALRETSERLRTLFESSPLPLLLLAPDGVVRMWSPAAERILGWTAAEAVGQPAPFVPAAEQDRFQALCQHVLAGETLQGLELLHHRKQGGAADFFLSAAPLHDAQNQVTGIMAVLLDITEKRQLEAQYLRAQRLDSVGKLAGGVAHDLNNILAPIMMAISLVREAPDSPEAKALLDTMESSVKRGASIIQQLLSFSRGSQGQKTSLSLLRPAGEMNKLMAETFPRNLTLRTELAPDLWLVHADNTQMHQVMLNLCVNARDAMPKGGTLTLSLHNALLDEQFIVGFLDAQPGPHVCLRVADTGSGIPPEILPQIFEPFFTTKPEGRGTGLGLPSVLNIVKNHGGFIQLHSQVEHGTEFTVYLPAQPATPLVASAAEGQPMPPGRGQLILFIDDEASVRMVTRRTLERNGYRVVTADNGVQGLALYTQRQGEIEAVVTDLIMPEMDGPTAIRALRQLNPHLPIIATSGEEPELNAAAQSPLGDIPFLKKPCTASALLTTLAGLFPPPAPG